MTVLVVFQLFAKKKYVVNHKKNEDYDKQSDTQSAVGGDSTDIQDYEAYEKNNCC